MRTPTGNLLTPPGRASFPVLIEPKPIGKNNKDGTPKYQLTILFDREAQQTAEYQDMKDAVEEAIKDRWGSNRPRKVKTPFLTIDDLRNKVPEGYTEEHTFIRLSTEATPGIVKQRPDGSLERLESRDQVRQELYAGCDVKAAVNVYAWHHDEGGPGVSFGLANIMKVGENTPFGAVNPDAADDFGAPVTGGASDDFMG